MTTQYPSRARSEAKVSVRVLAKMLQDQMLTVTEVAIVDRLVKDIQNRSVVNDTRWDSMNGSEVKLRLDIELPRVGGLSLCLGHSSGGHLDAD